MFDHDQHSSVVIDHFVPRLLSPQPLHANTTAMLSLKSAAALGRAQERLSTGSFRFSSSEAVASYIQVKKVIYRVKKHVCGC